MTAAVVRGECFDPFEVRGEVEAQLTVAASMTVPEYLLPEWLGTCAGGSPTFRSI